MQYHGNLKQMERSGKGRTISMMDSPGSSNPKPSTAPPHKHRPEMKAVTVSLVILEARIGKAGGQGGRGNKEAEAGREGEREEIEVGGKGQGVRNRR